MWKKRNLTVLGKITVVKTILLSKLAHLFISLPSPSKVYIKALETIFYNYIWGSKTDRVSRNQLVKDYKEGGCRMVHIDSFIKSLKLSWIRRIFYCEASWKSLFFAMYKTDQNKLGSFGNYYPIKLINNLKNDFWKETLLTYSELQSAFICDKNQYILSSSLWYNDNIKIDDTPVFFMNLYEKGVKFISDLFDYDGKIYTYDNLCNKYGVTLPIISYYGLRRSIFSHWPQLQSISNNVMLPLMPVFVSLSKKSTNGRIFYDILLKNIHCNTNFLVKWEKELDIPENIENHGFIMKYTAYAFQYTKDTTLRWFQYRISHRILATNEYLFKLKLKDSKLCTFCNIEPESLIHLFVECEHVENVWNMLESWISETCGFPLNFNKYEILFGKIGKKYEALNIISSIVKYHIYKRRCNQTALYFEGIKKEIKNYFITEKYIAKLEGKSISLEEKRKECFGLFNDD